MAKRDKPLILNVIRSKYSQQFILNNGGKFTVGQSGNNDLILYGTEYPKRHTLIAQKNGSFHINIKPFINGEVSLDRSTRRIDDLVKHDILPHKQNSYSLKLTPSKTGFLTVGDTKIEFSFQEVEQKKRVIAFKSSAYSWTRATLKSLSSDLLFKFIFLFVFTLNALIIYGLKDYKVNVEKKFDIEKMPERLAKFIIKPPEELFASESSTPAANLGKIEKADKSSDNKNKNKSSDRSGNNRPRKGSGKGNPVASAGLLGLIGGSGSSSSASSIVEALVDKGLITQLDDIISGGTNLKVGKNGTKDKIDPLDQLIATGGSGAIDDWLNDMEEDVPQVTLKKRAKVDLVKPQKVAGSAEALGYRTEQSITNIVLSRQGQIQYIYEKYLKRNPNLRGKISIEFTIAANGFVKSARVVDSTIKHPQFQRELLALVKRLKFGAIPSGDVTTVFPFLFTKVN